ncbi:MAG: glycosyltransferase family 2 protein [Ghiorsea sp.]|nr:glycosyltransferase family 2 protein [Ghiorsea sp.]
MNKLVTAIVVTFRSKLLIDQCLKSLEDEGVSQMIVVDNASDDGTADYVAKHYPHIQLLRNSENIGFAAANNLAIQQLEQADSDVLLLNPDAWLAPDALAHMQAAMRSDSRIAIVGPSIERDQQLEPSLLLRPKASASIQFILSGMRAMETGGFAGEVAPNYPWSSITDGDHVRGSCMLVRYQAIQDVGLLDDMFFLYFEETEWCLRFRNQGWRVVIAPDAQAYHLGKASVKTQESLPSLELMRSAVLFWQRVYTKPQALLLRVLLWHMVLVKYMLLLPFPSTKERRKWLLKVASLSMNPFRLPMVYTNARRPPKWEA